MTSNKTHFSDRETGATLCGRSIYAVDNHMAASDHNLQATWSGADKVKECKQCYRRLLNAIGTPSMIAAYNRSK